MASCRVRDCTKDGQPNARGMCWGHYHRWHRYGHPQAKPAKRPRKPFRERLLTRFHRPAVGCWCYPTDTERHPRVVREDGTRAPARPVVWEETVGPVAPGYVLYPLCKTTNCVRPDHHELTLLRPSRAA